MSLCVEAPACRAALNEATKLWPLRRRASDGICPRREHTAANPDSDHETGNAFDLTHDPGAGADCDRIVARLLAGRDPRVKYVIWERTIWRAYDRAETRSRPFLAAWTPEPYTAANPHMTHAHVSIWAARRHITRPWFQEVDDVTPDELRTILRDEVPKLVAKTLKTEGVSGVAPLCAQALVSEGVSANAQRAADGVAQLLKRSG